MSKTQITKLTSKTETMVEQNTNLLSNRLAVPWMQGIKACNQGKKSVISSISFTSTLCILLYF